MRKRGSLDLVEPPGDVSSLRDSQTDEELLSQSSVDDLNFSGAESLPLLDPKAVLLKCRLWIVQHLEECEDARLLKSDVRKLYATYCKEKGVPAVSATTLGKLLVDIFPSIQTRKLRLEGDKISRYYHIGVRWINQSIPVVTQAASDDASGLGVALANIRRSCPTLRRCPKGARIQMATVFASTIEKCVAVNDFSSWSELLMLPYQVLRLPSKSEKVTNLTAFVKSNIANRLSNNLNNRPLVTEFKNGEDSLRRFFYKKVEAKLSDGDVKGAIRLLLSDDIIAPLSTDTMQDLLDKHPEHPTPVNYPEIDTNVAAPIIIDEVLIRSAIKSFPSGSAGGLDGLRPQILKDMLQLSNGNVAAHFLKSLVELCNLMLRGKVPERLCPIIYGASLTALKKPAGGIRPIAVGNVWRRLVAKILCSLQKSKFVDYFAPHQLGFGLKSGAEIGAHAARSYFDAKHQEPKLFLKLDYKNAFNMLRRDNLLREIIKTSPEMFPFLNQCYRNSSNLYVCSNKILSQRGVQQGDPLGPACFCLAVQPLISQVTTEFNLWYLDDATIADTPEITLQNLSNIIQYSHQIGLELNFSKCEYCIIGACNENDRQSIMESLEALTPGIAKIEKGKAFLLGSPLTAESMELCLINKTSDLVKFSKRLENISSHSAYFLLKSSLAIPRLNYFLRCCPAWMRLDCLENYDAVLKSCIESILNSKLSSQAWSQSSLPVKMGGLGIRHAVEVATSSYLASFYGTLDLHQTLLPQYNIRNSCLLSQALSAWLESNSSEPPPDSLRFSQRMWERSCFEDKVEKLKNSASNLVEAARITSSCCPETGAWLQALPSPQLGTFMNNETFRISCALRLGLKICQKHVCICGAEVDEYGLHGLSCRFQKGRNPRHAICNDLISRALRTASVPSRLEPNGLSRTDNKHPDGMTLIPWKNGKCLQWDFTCVDTFCQSYVNDTAKRAGAAAEVAESRKHDKYKFLEDQFIFTPVAVETSGCWGQEGLSLIKNIGQRIAAISEEPRSTSFLVQRISIAVQRGNTSSILGTFPSSQDLSEIFYLR